MDNEQRLMDLAKRLLLAMMGSASTDKIKPVDWWTRAQSALEAAAAGSESLPQMVSIMARKLQIEEPSARTASSVCLIEDDLADLGVPFNDFARTCEDRAPYVVIRARVQREQEKAAWEEEAKGQRQRDESFDELRKGFV